MGDSCSHTGSEGHDSKVFSETSSVCKGSQVREIRQVSHPRTSPLLQPQAQMWSLCFPAQRITLFAKSIQKKYINFICEIVQDKKLTPISLMIIKVLKWISVWGNLLKHHSFTDKPGTKDRRSASTHCCALSTSQHQNHNRLDRLLPPLTTRFLSSSVQEEQTQEGRLHSYYSLQ